MNRSTYLNLYLPENSDYRDVSKLTWNFDTIDSAYKNITGRTIDSLADFINLFTATQRAFIVNVTTNLKQTLVGVGGFMTVIAYKTYDNNYIIFNGFDSQPRQYIGYVQLSNNAVSSCQDQPVRKVRVTFNNVTISSAGGYKKLCNYADVLPSGLTNNNIVSANVYSGTFSGAQTVELFSDGIYLYSSHAYSSKKIALDIVYTPFAALQADSDVTIDLT